MTELFLFGLVGLIAVFAAVFMLLSDNAVHSALFLIVTMGCIAFLFLLLNAPFLAMIQVTVYTGAIMVLFLFVIMLLGAERLQTSETSAGAKRFPWFTRAAFALVAALLLIVGIVMRQVNLDLQPNPGAAPQLRVLNAATDAGAVDVYANDELVASAVEFGADPVYVSLDAGNYTIKVQPQNGAPVTADVTLANGTQQTLVDYGDPNALQLGVVPDDNSTINGDHSARLTFFDAYTGVDEVQVVDFGSPFDANDTTVIAGSLAPGQADTPQILPENTVNWSFVSASDPTNVLFNLSDYTIKRDTSQLIVLTQQRVFNGTEGGVLRPTAIPVSVAARPAYGSPQAIGQELFTNYMLVLQLLALLLLAAMVGAIVLTHRQVQLGQPRSGGRRRVSRPLVNVIAAQVGHDVTSSEPVPELTEPAGDPAPMGE